MIRRKLVIFLGLLLSTNLVGAVSEKPSLRVTGEGEVHGVPDHLKITLGIETKDKVLSLAKKENDRRTKKFLLMLKKNKIKEKDVQTNQVHMNPRYSYVKGRRLFDGYEVRRNFNLTIRAIDNYDKILTGAIDAGVDVVGSVQFDSSKRKELESQARKKAIESAMQKAKELVTPLKQNVGKAISIEEVEVHQPGPHPLMRASSMGKMAESGPTLAPGEIKINSIVNVSFELK